MSNRTLFDRQHSLLEHLTGARLISGDVSGVAADPALRGLDVERLRFEAHFSFSKRVGKIRAMFPRTLDHMAGDDDAALWQAFAVAHTPATNLQIDNGAQFHAFLTERWTDIPPEPPYLADLARFELAFARARGFKFGDDDHQGSACLRRNGQIRTHPSVALVECDHDLLPLLDQNADPEAPEKRAVRFVIQASRTSPEPRVFEVAPAVHALLGSLDGWVRVRDLRRAGPRELPGLLRALADDGLVEVTS